LGATSPADFAVGLQPCPPAALPLPQALGRFLQQTGLPLPPRPSHLVLSFRRRAFLVRVILRRPSASYWLFVYVTRRRSRLRRFGRNRRHFVYVTFRVRFAAARAGRANRVGRPPVLDAVIVRQEAPPRGEGQLGIMFAGEAVGHVNQQLRQPGAGPEQGASQARDVDRHVSGLSRPQSAAAEPAVEARPEFKDELGGVKAVGGGACGAEGPGVRKSTLAYWTQY